MANKIDKVFEKASKFPIVSATSAVAAPLSFALAANTEIAAPALVVGFTSPVTMAAMGLLGGVNLFRGHSNIAKTFSAAAGGSAVVGGLAYGSLSASPGFEALAAYVASSIGLTAAGVFNTLAHFTRNYNLKISAAVDRVASEQKAAPAPQNKLQ